MNTNLDSIPMTAFTLPTRLAIRRYYEEHDWQELDDKTFLTPESATLMWFRLRQAPDEIFVKGKWATLQHLEAMIDDIVKNEITVQT